MGKRGFGAEQIVSKLRQIEVLMAQGKTAALACKDVGVSEQIYYRWCNRSVPKCATRGQRPDALPAS